MLKQDIVGMLYANDILADSLPLSNLFQRLDNRWPSGNEDSRAFMVITSWYPLAEKLCRIPNIRSNAFVRNAIPRFHHELLLRWEGVGWDDGHSHDAATLDRIALGQK